MRTIAGWSYALWLLALSACGSDSSDGSGTGGTSADAGLGGGAAGGIGGAGGAGGAGGSSGAAGAGGTVCELGVPGGACDPLAQDCSDPCSSRCVLYRSPGAAGLTEPLCIAPRGQRAPFESCQRYGGAVGDDDCAKGLFCSYGVGRKSGVVPEEFCAPYCLADGDCTDGFCSALTKVSVTPPAGYCVATCTPYANGCEGNYACLKFGGTDGKFRLTCSDQFGSKQAGVACQGGDCAPGLSCEQVNGLVCTPFCDATHACPNAEPCVPAPGGEGYSVCDL